MPAPAEPDGLLIHGDNLLALKALEQEYAGKVKCIYIDPPYNTGSAFEHYDDMRAHSEWLNLMTPRLKLLWTLLSKENGTLLISINDDECHYLKVLCDELFGRNTFVASLVWNYEGNTDNQARIIRYHEYILVYSKTGEIDDPNVIDPNIPQSSKLFKDEIRNTIVKNGIKNPVKAVTLPIGFPCSFEKGIINKKDVNFPKYDIDVHVDKFKTTNQVIASSGWSSKEILEEFIKEEFSPVKDSKDQETVFELKPSGAIEAVKRREQKKGHFVSLLRGFGTTNQMRLFLDKLGLKFTYPKPVELISYLIKAFTDEDDIVLDSFAGSGTTAHSVLQLNNIGGNRKFILVELLETNAHNVIRPRLNALIDGRSDLELPALGGSYKFYNLAPSLLNKDKYGEWIISEGYNATMLAAAMAKHEGFKYEPHESLYWKQGQSSERDFVFTTTQFITLEVLDAVHEEMRPDESLLICCKAFSKGCKDRYPNITIKKIPHMLLGRCEFGKEDYSLNIVNLPEDPDAMHTEEWTEEEKPTKSKSKKKKKEDAGEDQLTLL